MAKNISAGFNPPTQDIISQPGGFPIARQRHPATSPQRGALI
jgi:hypothetical protein